MNNISIKRLISFLLGTKLLKFDTLAVWSLQLRWMMWSPIITEAHRLSIKKSVATE